MTGELREEQIQEIKWELQTSNISLRKKIFNKGMKISDKLLHNLYQRQLNNTDFSIISNNCWGGVISEHFGLKKNSPTVGCYFYSDDYIKFVLDLRRYLSLELKIINCIDSKYFEIQKIKKQENVPVGLLGDVEIFFLHYRDEKEIIEKWKRRVERINWENMIIKFSEQNLCTEEHLRSFEKIPYSKKIVFTKKEYDFLDSQIVIQGYDERKLSDIHDYRFHMKEIIEIINK